MWYEWLKKVQAYSYVEDKIMKREALIGLICPISYDSVPKRMMLVLYNKASDTKYNQIIYVQ